MELDNSAKFLLSFAGTETFLNKDAYANYAPINQRVPDNVVSILEKLGYKNIKNAHPNYVFARGEGTKEHLLFQGHLDTVPIFGNIPQGEIRDSNIYMRGAVDDLGPVCAVLAAVYETNYKPSILLTLDEEAKTQSILFALENEDFSKTKLCINTEPSNFDVITSRFGRFWDKVIVFGTAAHGSLDPKITNRSNAIYKACDLITIIREISEEPDSKSVASLGRIYDELNNSRINSVPARCYFEYALRTATDTFPIEFRNNLIAKAKDRNLLICIDFNIENVLNDPPYSLSSKECSNFNSILDLIKKYKPDSKYAPGAGFAESLYFIKKGIPTVSIGPSTQTMHKADEFISIEDLVKTKNIYADIIKQF